MARLTLAELPAAVAIYNRYFDSLMDCFVGREEIVNTLRFAMAQRQHHLIFGPPGTAKTNLCDVAFGGITGAHQFAIELSMYMSEDALYGPYDVRAMREDGVLRHRTEGMLPEADIARIGEFLDGNMALLRSLLGSLHERRMRRGRQIIDMPLLTVYADTNCHPGEFLRKNPYAWAVLDRLLFMSDLNYLQTAEEVSDMLYRFQSGATNHVTEQLPLELIRQISELVVEPPSLIQDRIIFTKLGEAFTEYRIQRAALVQGGLKVILPEISDRRLCLATQMLEVVAVLAGRLEALPEDMRQCGLVLGTTHEEYSLWNSIADRKSEEARQARELRLQNAQALAIDGILQHAAGIGSGSNTIQVDIETLKALETQLQDTISENDEIEHLKQQAAAKLAEVRRNIQERVLQEAGVAS